MPLRRAYLLLLLSGVLFALVVATKAQYAVALPAFVIYLALWGWNPYPPAPSPLEGEGEIDTSAFGGYPISPAPTQHSALSTQHSMVAWFLGLGIGLVPLFAYNLAVFGGALTTGYGADLKGTFKTPLYEGVIGLLVSPGKGLLWYALPLVLALWGLPRFARKHKAETLFIAALFASLVVFFGMYSFWPGDGSWGPRYMIPLLPFAMLPALETIESALGHAMREGRRLGAPALAVLGVLALGFLVNVESVLVNFDTYINVVNDDATRYWQPAASPILGHLNLLGQRTSELASRLIPEPGTVCFKSGFSYSEGDKSKGELLPRWTKGAGVLDIHPASNTGPLVVTIQLADHRPPPLPRANVSILADGKPVQTYTNVVASQSASKEYTFQLPAEVQELTIESDTWNPSQIKEGWRNENLGVMLEKISISQGGTAQTYSLVESLSAPPYYPQPRWYYDPGTHHPSDLWLTYLPEIGMGNKAMLALGLPFILVALGCIRLGLWRLKAG